MDPQWSLQTGKDTELGAIGIGIQASLFVDLQRKIDTMSQKKERRTHRRRPAHIIAEYRVNEGVFRDIIKNIGTCGVFIKTQRKIASGQKIELRFPLFTFEHHIQIIGTVLRSAPGGFAVSFDQPIAGIIGKNGAMTKIVHEIDRPPEPLD